MKRRQFVQAGIVGSAALAAAGTWVAWRDNGASRPLTPTSMTQRRIDRIVGALAPVLLAGTLPSDPATRTEATARVAADIGQVIAAFTPPVRNEVHELFSLLDLGLTRWPLTGITDWSNASPEDVGAFLERWRHSRISMLQSAYHALHDLVLGAWYASDSTWAELGYPGPPRLS